MTDQFGRPITPKPTVGTAPPTTPPPVPPVVPPSPPTSAFLPAAPLPITRDTPFRATGDVSLSAWEQQFRIAGSPFSVMTQSAMWDAAQPVSALVLDRLRIESSYGKSMAARNNPLGLRIPGTLTFQEFASPVDAVKELVRRWSDPTYKGGVYMPKDLSLAAMLTKYSPPSENDTEALIRAAVTNINQWRSGSRDPGSVTNGSSSSVTFGKVPVPKNFQDLQVPDANNNSWDNLGQRKLRGIVYHRMQGTLWGTNAYFNQHAPGLTDWGIDHKTGEIIRWNDYLGRGKAGISPNRSPWASGGPGGESGDGIAFVAKFGRDAINRELSAIEISGSYKTPTTPDVPLEVGGIEAIVALSAYLADQAKIPWDTYPVVPATGLVFTYWHNEFQGEKPCPGRDVMNATPAIIERTVALLKKYQTGS